jgi:hypothetical protein
MNNMANYCENILRITGDKDDLKAFLDFSKHTNNKGIELDFSFMPYHPELNNNRYDRDKWIETIGTKWDCDDKMYKINYDENHIIILFETAWTPPVPMLQQWRDRFPDLTFDLRYYEEAGFFKGQNGTIEETHFEGYRESMDYHKHKVSVWDYISFKDVDGCKSDWKTVEMKGQFQ